VECVPGLIEQQAHRRARRAVVSMKDKGTQRDRAAVVRARCSPRSRATAPHTARRRSRTRRDDGGCSRRGVIGGERRDRRLRESPKYTARVKTSFAIRLMYSNTEGGSRDPEKLWSLLKTTVSNDDPMSLFAVINNALIFLGAMNEGLHQELEAEFADDQLKNALTKSRATSEGPVILFNRPAHLIAMKLLLGIDHADGTDDSLTRIGELTLRANDYVESPEDLWDTDPDLLGIIANFAPVWELLNPRDVFQLFVRTYLLLTDHVVAHAGMTKLLTEQLRTAPPNLLIDGLTIDDYLALVFGIFTNVRTAVLKQKTCIIDMDQFYRVTTLPAEGVRSFLARRCGDAATFLQELQLAVTDSDAFSAYITNGTKAMDATVIKQRPIFRRTDGRHSVLDARFLIELLSTTLYWTLFDAIPDKKARNTFSTMWGECFESLVVRELEFFYPAASGILRTRIPIDGGEIDALLDFGEFVVVLEIKSGLLAKDPRLMRGPEQLRTELHKKFVDGTGVSQLVKAVRAIAGSEVETSLKGCRIYPVLVADEAALQCFGANRYLDQQFAAQLTDRPPNVAPLTVMLIDELEAALPYFSNGRIAWREVLDARFEADGVSPDSFHTTLATIRSDRKVPHHKNGFLGEHGERIGKLIVERYRFGETEVIARA
jgi:hypothetical protein